MHGLEQGLSLVALIAGTLEYAILLRHREEQRQTRRERDGAADSGLQGLVRLFAVDEPVTDPTYRPE